MQEDQKIEVHAVQRVHFLPRPDGGLGFALVIETQDKGTLGFALPLPSLVQIFEVLPKMFADLLRKQPVQGSSVPENLTHIYWDKLASVIASPQIDSPVIAATKPAPLVKAAATPKIEEKKTASKKVTAKTTAKLAHPTAPIKKVAPKIVTKKTAVKAKSTKK